MLVVAALVIGCGGDDDDSSDQPTAGTTTERATTKAEFIRQADEICRGSARELTPIARAIRSNAKRRDVAGLAAEYRKLHTLYAERVTELRRITPPSDDGGIGREFIDGLSDATQVIGQTREALEAGDDSKLQALGAELRRLGNRASSLAQGYGFKECGSGD